MLNFHFYMDKRKKSCASTGPCVMSRASAPELLCVYILFFGCHYYLCLCAIGWSFSLFFLQTGVEQTVYEAIANAAAGYVLLTEHEHKNWLTS